MAREGLINTADDMRWLRDVHLPRLPAKYKSAVIVGNEDYPDRIDVYERRAPRVSDVPLVFKADDEGVFKETSTHTGRRHHATKKSSKKGQLEVLGGYKIDLDRGGQLLRERIDVTTPGDYGADPLGDGTFRMVPSGDIVDFAERTRRLDDYARRSRRSHSTKKSAKKSPAQLDREIAEALSGGSGQVKLKDRYSGGHAWLTVRDGRVVGAMGSDPKRYVGLTIDEAKHHARYGGKSRGRSSHATIKYDRDDAREFGVYAYRMEQTKAQAQANARAQGFAAHLLDAVEAGWDAERRDTIHGGFVGSSHATRRRADVEVDTSAYRRTHGAEPRGSGNWKFVIGAREYAYGDESDLYRPAESRGAYKAGRPQLSFAKAKEYAIAEAKRRGATIVGVGP